MPTDEGGGISHIQQSNRRRLHRLESKNTDMPNTSNIIGEELKMCEEDRERPERHRGFQSMCASLYEVLAAHIQTINHRPAKYAHYLLIS